MTEFDLLNIAEDDGIDILSFDCKNAVSMSMMTTSGNCYIGLDKTFDIIPSFQRRTQLAHELGHCEQGAFYNIYSSCDCISRHEYKADKWAIEKLLPKEEMEEAFENGYTEVWELADLFDVTEDLIKKALFIYFDNQSFL